MKGISVWIWVMGGIIVGMILFVLFVQIMSYVSMSRDKENAKAILGELAASVNSFCDAHLGEKSLKTIAFPDFVNVVFTSKDGREYEVKNNRTFGKWTCIKMGKEISCEKLNCELEMILIEQKPSFISWTGGIFGSAYQEYQLEIAKTECGVSALKPEMNSDCKT